MNKRLIVVFCYILVSCSSVAQSELDEKKNTRIDNLEEITTKTNQDIKKIVATEKLNQKYQKILFSSKSKVINNQSFDDEFGIDGIEYTSDLDELYKRIDKKIKFEELEFKKKIKNPLYLTYAYREYNKLKITKEEYQKALKKSKFYYKRNIDKSLEYAEKAGKIAIRLWGNESEKLLDVYHQISNNELNSPTAMNRFIFEEASLDIAKKNFGINDIRTIIRYVYIANIYYIERDIEQSISFLNKALSLIKNIKNKNSNKVGDFYKEIGTLYQKIAQEYSRYTPEAILYSNKAKAYQQYPNKSEDDLSSNYQKKAKFYIEEKNYNLALDYLKKVEKIEEAHIDKEYFKKDTPILAEIYHDLGIVYKALNRPAVALKYYKKVLQFSNDRFILKTIPNAHFYHDISQLYFQVNDYKNAYQYEKKSLQFFSEMKIKLFKKALYSEKLTFLTKNNYNTQYLLQVAYAYQQTLSNQKKRQKIILEAFKFWLSTKGDISNVESFLSKLRVKTKDKKVKQVIEDFLQIKRNYAQLLLLKMVNPKKFSTQQEKALKEAEKQEQKLERYLAPHLEHYSSLFGGYIMRNPELFDISNITDILHPDELYIDFAKVGNEYYSFTINSKGTIGFYHIKNQNTPIDTLVKNFRKAIISKQPTHALGKKLYHQLVQPIENISSYKKLIISPDGLLTLLPFEALNNYNKNYLIQKYDIVYVLSAKELYKTRNSATFIHFPKGIISLSFIDYDTQSSSLIKKESSGRKDFDGTLFHNFNGLNRLKNTIDEAKIMQNIFRKNQFISYENRDVTKKLLYSFNAPQILHLSTHSFYGNDDKIKVHPLMKSALALSEYNAIAESDDIRGIMSALEFSTLNLYPTELVFFSSCESAKGDIYSAEGVSGLNRGARVAGAERIISTLWSVNEIASLKFTTRYYTFLAKHQRWIVSFGTNKIIAFEYEKALRTTKLSMIKEHPFFWAGFIQYGVAPIYGYKGNPIKSKR
jgi:CHAT domain-containing protein